MIFKLSADIKPFGEPKGFVLTFLSKNGSIKDKI
jgi:hypothetical protein